MIFLWIAESKVVKNRAPLDVPASGGRSEPWEARWPQMIRGPWSASPRLAQP
jgi:hypothetical protein